MFQLQTDKWGLVEVSFQHFNPAKTIEDNSAGTKCTISKVNGKEKELKLLRSAQSYLSIHDQYCKEIGRKVALTRALEHLQATREQRTRFWMEYHYTRQRDREQARKEFTQKLRITK